MLRQLSVRNIVLVEQLDLEFEAGLGVLTGETGAGKSILLDSLGLALGARADAGLVRSGEESASVSADLELPAAHPASAPPESQRQRSLRTRSRAGGGVEARTASSVASTRARSSGGAEWRGASVRSRARNASMSS